MRQRFIELRFLSTLSLRRATLSFYAQKRHLTFLSTLSLRRATASSLPFGAVWVISIHALLAESDGIGLVFLWWGVRFLSTLSLRRATPMGGYAQSFGGYFYPRSPCGERRWPRAMILLCSYFYPRSPCGERRILLLPGF